jgi:hypothetical protein
MTSPPDSVAVSWGTLLLLGAFHGINPGMGWLFAVALGMQENRAAAVWRAMLPLGVGHACAVAAAIAMVIVAGVAVPAAALRWPIAAILAILGVRRLIRHRHPRWGGMRMGMGGLTIWSFLVATAHGAGLMVLPVWLHDTARVDHHHASATLTSGLTAALVHGAAYLGVTAVIAWIVFSKLGVGLLRTAWINLDVIWAVALIVSGACMAFINP